MNGILPIGAIKKRLEHTEYYYGISLTNEQKKDFLEQYTQQPEPMAIERYILRNLDQDYIDKQGFKILLSKQLRHHSISQKELADMLQVHPNNISRWLNGQVMPYRSTIAKIANVLNIDPEDLSMSYQLNQEILRDSFLLEQGKVLNTDPKYSDNVDVAELEKSRNEIISLLLTCDDKETLNKIKVIVSTLI